MRIKFIRGIVIGISLSINLCLFIILFTPFTEQLYKPLIVDEPVKKSEVIVILTCGGYDSGLPTFRSLIRIRKGLELYNNNWADKIICAGGDRLVEAGISSAQAMKQTLISYGVQRENIFVQDETINTFNDITYLLKKFERNFNFNNAVFVTSSYHTYRTKKILEKKQIKASVISAEPYELNPVVWSEKMDLFKEVAREYMAICYFKIKGWI